MILMRMQRKDAPSDELFRAGCHNTGRRITVFDRKRKCAALERCAHPGPLAFRHVAEGDEADSDIDGDDAAVADEAA